MPLRHSLLIAKVSQNLITKVRWVKSCNLSQLVFLWSMEFLYLETASLTLHLSQTQTFASFSMLSFICHPICLYSLPQQTPIKPIIQFINRFFKFLLSFLKFYHPHPFIWTRFLLFLVSETYLHNAIWTANKSLGLLGRTKSIYLSDALIPQLPFLNFILLCSNLSSLCSQYYLIWNLSWPSQASSYLHRLCLLELLELSAFRQLLEYFDLKILSIIIVRNQQPFKPPSNLDFWLIEIWAEEELSFFVNLDPFCLIFINFIVPNVKLLQFQIRLLQMKIGLIKIRSSFSLFTKVPKTVQPATEPKSWFAKLFTKNQNSVTFVLLQQLFEYLQGNNLIHKQFPYLDNTERFRQNSMALHVHLLRDRMKQQTQLPRSELQKMVYNLQSHFFPGFAPFANPAIPTKNFALFYAEAYLNKLELFSEMIKDHEWALSPNKQFLQFQQYAPLFRKILYENRVEVDHVQLLKFCKYYLAHKKYLSMLDWNDIAQYKVKWGLESLKFINQVEKGQKSK